MRKILSATGMFYPQFRLIFPARFRLADASSHSIKVWKRVSADLSRYAIALSKYKDRKKCQGTKTANNVSNVLRSGIGFFGTVGDLSAQWEIFRHS